ncbi:hypothetical protein AB0N33_11115 [Pseudarthrobacter oxydans]|uniref:hypothetical protein n=1 Tax=Pseudarthrobacter oxydans TaxID=1671 RepID=UPI00341EE89D
MSESTQNTTEQNPFTKPGFIISAALVVALIAAVIVIFMIPKGDGDAQPGQAPSVNSSAPDSTMAGSESVCGLKASSETALGRAPQTEWALVGKIAAPNDPQSYGPGVEEQDGFRYCYAQSPTGALYAAANLIAMTSAGNPDLTAKVTEKLLVPGPGRDAAMKDAATTSSSSNSAATSVQFRGFVLKSYSPEKANVDVAMEGSNGVLGHAVLPMEWIDGDWKLAVADSGEMVNDFSQVRDLSGFIPWSGV